jgi:hypothetical protein
MPMNPNSDLVGEKWLGGISGLAPAMVATTLPRDVTTWTTFGPNKGFVVVTVVGGDQDLYLPIRHPVYQVDCWATRVGSNTPPWGTANHIAELVRAHVEARPVVYKRALTFTDKGDYLGARIIEAILRSEPRRGITPGPSATGDEGGYARYMLDLQLDWCLA